MPLSRERRNRCPLYPDLPAARRLQRLVRLPGRLSRGAHAGAALSLTRAAVGCMPSWAAVRSEAPETYEYLLPTEPEHRRDHHNGCRQEEGLAEFGMRRPDAPADQHAGSPQQHDPTYRGRPVTRQGGRDRDEPDNPDGGLDGEPEPRPPGPKPGRERAARFLVFHRPLSGFVCLTARGSAAARYVHRENTAEAAGCGRLLGCSRETGSSQWVEC